MLKYVVCMALILQEVGAQEQDSEILIDYQNWGSNNYNSYIFEGINEY